MRYSWQPAFEEITKDKEDYLTLWRRAMNWVREEVDNNTLKSEFIKWALGKYPENINHYKMLPPWHYLTSGRIAYLINKDAQANDDSLEWLHNSAISLMNIKIEIDENKSKFEQEKLSSKEIKIIEYVNAYSFIDAIRTLYADDIETLENKIYERLRKSEKSAALLKKLYTHYKDSLTESIAERDIEEIEKTITPLVAVINILANLSGNNKVAQYKGDKKSLKAAKKVGFKAVDNSTNSISLNPQQIPGMSMAVVYNSSNRRIMLYIADSESGLGMKGTKITGFDTTKSYSKTLRSPKETLQHVKDATNSNRVSIVLDQHVNGKKFEVNGKLNKNILVVKTFK